MEIILKIIRALLRLETNADKIFSPLEDIITKANAHVADQEGKAAKEADAAAKLQAKIDARNAEIAKTQKKAANVKKLMEAAE